MWEVTFIEMTTGRTLTDTVEAHTIGGALDQLRAVHGTITLERARQLCSCHHEKLASHELCCGHDEGRNPNCPVHGDGSYVG